MTNVTSLFDRFDQTPINHYFTPAELNALVTTGTIRNEPTDFFKELSEVTEYLQNLYHTENFEILKQDIQIGLDTSWDKSEINPLIQIHYGPREYHYSESELFTHIQTEFDIKRDNLPKLLHSLYINQFINTINQTPSSSLPKFPNRREIQKSAMQYGNQTALDILQYKSISGFSDTGVIGIKQGVNN